MKELSNKLGYKGNQVWKWEKGKRKIKNSDIKKLVNLGILNQALNGIKVLTRVRKYVTLNIVNNIMRVRA